MAKDGAGQHVFKGSIEALVKRFLGGIICMASLAFLIVGIAMKGVRWELHWSIAIILLFSSLFLLFLLEGTQIAVVRLKEGDHIPPNVFEQSPEVAKLLTEMGEFGVANYLIGRQVLVCANVYLVAALTELKDPLVSRAITIFAGIFTVVCFGQLIPQLMADVSPILFCRIPGVRAVIIISTFLSKLGVGHYSYWIGSIWLNYLHDGNFSSDFQDRRGSTNSPGEETGEIKLVHKDNDMSSQKRMQTLSQEIFEELNGPFDLDVKSKDHIPPHFLLAISTGLLHHQTAPKAEALLKELLSTVEDDKKKERLTTFLRRTQVSV